MAGKRELDKTEMFRKIMPSSREGEGQPPEAEANVGGVAAPGGGAGFEESTGQESTPSPESAGAAAAAPGGMPVAEEEPQPRDAHATEETTAGPADAGGAPEPARALSGAQTGPDAAAPAAGEGLAGPANAGDAERAAAPAASGDVPGPGPGSEALPNGPGENSGSPSGSPVAQLLPDPEQDLAQALSGFAASVNSLGSNPEAEKYPEPVNIAELLVDRLYPRYRERLDGCECQRCRDDVCGMALNKIKPRYVASDRLREEDLTDRSLVTEVVTALVRALFIVKRNPHHDDAHSVRK